MHSIVGHGRLTRCSNINVTYRNAVTVHTPVLLAPYLCLHQLSNAVTVHTLVLLAPYLCLHELSNAVTVGGLRLAIARAIARPLGLFFSYLLNFLPYSLLSFLLLLSVGLISIWLLSCPSVRENT